VIEKEMAMRIHAELDDQIGPPGRRRGVPANA